jgi:signal transduction histidine kinase
MAILFAGILTRPLAKLQSASMEIANGNYTKRTQIRTNDEIGVLSNSFDTMADSIEEHIDQLKLQARQRDDFVNAFTHELKTPMTSIIGYSTRLKKMDLSSEQYAESIDYINSEAIRLELLSNKLLHLMGLQEHSIELQSVSIALLFKRLEHTLTKNDKDVSISFHCNVTEHAAADADLLDCMIRNLIDNAVNGCTEKGIVRVDASSQKDHILISIRDNGIGIQPQDLERIAEPFYMVDKSRAHQQGGSGLGLSLCTKIAEIHHTELRFTSDVGIGTTVEFAIGYNKEGEAND